MSRRRGEFEHRTSIFEGAYRAWSHLGGIEPHVLETTAVSELDPLSNPIHDDPRLRSSKYIPHNIQGTTNPDGSARRIHPYEPLPRTGLSHPYVQAILSPWLGPDADNEAIELGLTTLRTWWQHRRKGESGSAIAALGTEKMKGVVEGYTRHFFTLAHCLVVEDREQPPRTLMVKMKAIEKQLKKQGKFKENGSLARASVASTSLDGSDDQLISTHAAENNAMADDDVPLDGLTPLERLHATQKQSVQTSGTIHPTIPVDMIGYTDQQQTVQPIVDLKAKCNPNKIDLPGVMAKVNKAASQLTHRGNAPGPNQPPAAIASHVNARHDQNLGDPNGYPLVFTGMNGDHVIAMALDGITCAHCVKIVETVLKGCTGTRSPIDGLLDAAADERLNSMVVKIDKPENAKRIAFEAARNLSMVGYTAKTKEVPLEGSDLRKAKDVALAAFRSAAQSDPQDIFHWTAPCTCPDNGVLRENCDRHSQFARPVFEAMENRAMNVMRFMMQHASGTSLPVAAPEPIGEPPMNLYGAFGAKPDLAGAASVPYQQVPVDSFDVVDGSAHPAPRNHSIISQNNPLMRCASITSQASFGRAMSGLSALSIDWENLEDFDLDIDPSSFMMNAASVGQSVQATTNEGASSLLPPRYEAPY